MSEQHRLNTLEVALTKSVVEEFNIKDLNSDAFCEKFFELFEIAREDCEQDVLQSYKDQAPKVLSDSRAAIVDFESGCFQRWKPSFDHLEMMWTAAQELGEIHGKNFKEKNEDADDSVMAALAQVFPRALLVSQEIICLLKGGFPDGAMARWRSLHELTVTAMYIAKHKEIAAVPYLLSFHFSARRAAHQMDNYSQQAEIGKFTSEELNAFDVRCAEAEVALGRKIEKDRLGEWPRIMGSHTDFAAIEKNVGMDHWRPRYKWASAHTHANYRPIDKLLGMAEGPKEAYLVGASNSGFVDPFQMSAISLAQITAIYLTHAGNVDCQVELPLVS